MGFKENFNKLGDFLIKLYFFYAQINYVLTWGQREIQFIMF